MNIRINRLEKGELGILKPVKPHLEVKLENIRCLPVRANEDDAGADLVSTSTMEVYPGELRTVDTGVAIKIPYGYVGLVNSRSSQGKLRVSLANSTGVIDAGYRGNIKVMLVNEGEDPYKINAFDTKVAQLVIVPVMLCGFSICTDEDDWLDSTRGAGGFGSTDNKGIK